MTEYHPLVKETSTDTGTGSLSLDGGAVTGFQSFEDVLPSGGAVHYTVVADNGDFEVGFGGFAVSTTNYITRSDANVIYSSNSNNRVSFAAGSKTVMMAPSPVHARLNAYRIQVDSGSYADASNLDFDSVIFDPNSAADSTLPTEKLLVPSWANFMRLSGSLYVGSGDTEKGGVLLEALSGATYTDPLEKFMGRPGSAGGINIAVATGWFEPSTFSGESGIRLEVDVSSTVSISGVITVEYRD